MVCACDYGCKKSVIGSPGTEIADNSEPSFGCQELWSSGRAASPLNLWSIILATLKAHFRKMWYIRIAVKECF